MTLGYLKKLSQGCFIEYNNAYLYEYIKLSKKIQKLVINPFTAIGTAYAVSIIFGVFAIWTAFAVSIIIIIIIIIIINI
jgi:hypothetical protein